MKTGLSLIQVIAIGPEKTGTSLLYEALKKHPEVSLPPIKEIRYWNEGGLIPSHSLITLLTSKHWHYIYLRACLKRTVTQLIPNVLATVFLGRKLEQRFFWNLRYITGKRHTFWYSNLFVDDGKVTGDISPLYYHCSESRIKECHNHNPNMKVILFIREPIERIWSKARMNLLKHKRKNAVEFESVDFLLMAQKVHKQWRPYRDTIQLWKSYFKNVHVAIYDELQQNPQEWYRKICNFLEIEVNRPVSLKERINEGVNFEIPQECERTLFKQYGKELKELGEFYNLPRWLARYEQLKDRFPGTQLNK